MNVVTDIEKFDPNYVIFQNSVKNTIIEDCNFSRIIYSNELFMLNGIFLKVILKIKTTEKYYNKYKYNFSYEDNKTILDMILNIEKLILCMFNIPRKSAVFSIYNQFANENIKLFTDIVEKNGKFEDEFILKISGIWESDKEYGLTYKFMSTNQCA